MDRLQNNGIIAFITNRSFIDSRAFDGFRKCVQDDFDFCYIIDTKSDVRANPKIAGTTHNVFGIQTGVAIMFLVRKEKRENKTCHIQYISLDDFWPKEQKLQWIAEYPLQKIPFERITPDSKNNNWINLADTNFDTLLPVIDKDVKAGKSEKAIFKLFSRGVETTRDEWVYDLNFDYLINKIKYFIEKYNSSVAKGKMDLSIKWSSSLEAHLGSKQTVKYEKSKVKKGLYRPFFKLFHYSEKLFNHRLTENHYSFFGAELNKENILLNFSGLGSSKPFHCLGSNVLSGLDTLEKTQCIPLYRFAETGERVENITNWGLEQFCNHYGFKPLKEKKEKTLASVKTADNTLESPPEFDQPHLKDNEKQMLHEPEPQYGKQAISKEDIFNYVYAVLHHPAYRKKYELNLKRDFPRIPFYDDFFKWVDWGKQLMDLHINYETVKPFGLKAQKIAEKENPKAKLKADKETGEIVLDENTVLSGIPAIAWQYKLGNRSALEWILDQYKEGTPSDPTIAERFNTYRFADYKKQVIDLLNRVCTVSVETMEIINQMPAE